MTALASFTVWRAAVTAWRSLPDRFYFFPSDNWLGSIDHRWLGDWLSRVDHGWLNDFLLGPGTVACFFMAFTALYLADGLLHGDSIGTLFSHRTSGGDSAFADHRRLMKIILYGLLARALIGGWGEEVGLFQSDFVFDPWDLTVELGGVVVGAWLVHTLSYPLFSRAPHFSPEPDVPGLRDLRSRFGIDALSVLASGFYIAITDPFELRPLTLMERQSLALEIALVFILFRAGLKRGMHPSSNTIALGPLFKAGSSG